MKISHSKLKAWRRCRAAYNYRYHEKLQRKTKARPLMFGSLIHEALELTLAGKSANPLFNKYQKEIDGVFEEERVEFGLDTVVPDARRVLTGYQNTYKDDGLKYLAVEQEFVVPLIEDIMFEGKIDGIVQQSNSRVFLFERKTCKQMPEESVRMSDIQAVSYFWALKQMGSRRKVDGIIWDYVRSKPPTQPEPLKNGQLSRAKIDTLPEVYAEAVAKYKLDMADYQEFIDSLENKRSSFFKRVTLPFSSHLVKSVVTDMQTTALEIRDLGGKRKERNLGRDCNWCEFFDLCQSELRGLDSDFIRERSYKPRVKDVEKKAADEE